MPLPYHSRYTRPATEDVPIVRFIKGVRRWLANLPNRSRCWFSGHWWRPYDLTSDECACCGARRSLRVRKELP